MDKVAVITSFLFTIIAVNIPLLYGTVGEILVEKSGSLNLGVEGFMAMGRLGKSIEKRRAVSVVNAAFLGKIGTEFSSITIVSIT